MVVKISSALYSDGKVCRRDDECESWRSQSCNDLCQLYWTVGLMVRRGEIFYTVLACYRDFCWQKCFSSCTMLCFWFLSVPFIMQVRIWQAAGNEVPITKLVWSSKQQLGRKNCSKVFFGILASIWSHSTLDEDFEVCLPSLLLVMKKMFEVPLLYWSWIHHVMDKLWT